MMNSMKNIMKVADNPIVRQESFTVEDETMDYVLS